jgi:hypothetical protein
MLMSISSSPIRPPASGAAVEIDEGLPRWLGSTSIRAGDAARAGAERLHDSFLRRETRGKLAGTSAAEGGLERSVSVLEIATRTSQRTFDALDLDDVHANRVRAHCGEMITGRGKEP